LTHRRTVIVWLLAACACTSRQPEANKADTTARSVTMVTKRRSDSAGILTYGGDSTSRVAESRLTINGIRIGMRDVKVRTLLGSPVDSTLPSTEDVTHEDSVFVWRYHGLQVSFDGHTVYDVRCDGAACVTADSVRIGASRKTVVARYGPGFSGYDASSDVLIYHPDKPLDCALVFTFVDDRVARIALECDYS
jgi:hypothetical protein